jgi:Glycoside hydrolase family 44
VGQVRLAGVWICAFLSVLLTACGGSGGGGSTTPPPVTPGITSIKVTPSPATALIGNTVQFSATVNGNGTFDTTVKWSVAAPSGWSGSAGAIDSNGLYVTPYPAPATVTVVATSSSDVTKSGSVSLAINAPSATSGPAVVVDAGSQAHAINPLIYGMNAYQQDPAVAKQISLPVNRWGGDATTRYNYLLDVTNSANDYYFENGINNNSAYPDVSDFNSQVSQDIATGTKTLGTVPLIGWTTARVKACGFSVAKYGAQQKTDPYWPDCGNGMMPDGKTSITGNNPSDTSTPVDETFVNGWVKYLVNKFGSAANGGVAIYDLDNEPEWWYGVHKDVHPIPMSYDEVTNKGLSYAKAIKDADPTAEVSGPVISFWPAYFYSMKDVTTGWGTGPCYCTNGNPVDRLAHRDVPLIEYYLQQFKKSQDANGVRLLDYVDLHTYFAATNAGLNPAGDTDLQQARLNSTRVFWDPTYTDPAYTDPNDRTSSAKPFPPQLIPMMRNWVAQDYPGTKLAITEYNWGGQEHINGAVAQADILGIFGREGLDMGTLWGPPDPTKQVPGLAAFLMYQNYDGASSKFGDMSISASSANQGQLAVYAALRTSDSALTIMVINKTYSDLATPISLANFSTASKAKVFQYSNANLAAISALPDQAVTPPPTGGTTSSVSVTAPAQSITLLVVPRT